MFNILSNCLYCCGLRIITQQQNDSRHHHIDDTHPNQIKFAVMTNQTNPNVMRFFRKYPEFFQNYCFCLQRKVEPTMTNAASAAPSPSTTTTAVTTTTIGGDPIDEREVNSATSHGTPNTIPVIPIAIESNVYVIVDSILCQCLAFFC